MQNHTKFEVDYQLRTNGHSGSARGAGLPAGNVNIGISDEGLAAIVVLLNRALSNTSILTIKTRKFHWDVVGPQFVALHELWGQNYTVLAEFADKLAERVRARGGFPIGTAAGFIEHATLKEHPGTVSSATDAVEALLADHELVARSLRSIIHKCVELDDPSTADLLTNMLEGHENMAWIHRSFLEGESLRGNGQAPSGNIPELA